MSSNPKDLKDPMDLACFYEKSNMGYRQFSRLMKADFRQPPF